jgi:hypothetical protein
MKVKTVKFMSYKDKIGESAYFIKDNKIRKDIIVEGREAVHLNTGSDRHGKLLDPQVQYRFWNDEKSKWYKESEIFMSKEDILNTL